MTSQANKALVRRASHAFSEGAWDAFVELLHDDVAYTLIGTTTSSGTLQGKPAVRRMLNESLAAGLATPGIEMTIETLIAEGDYVAEQARGRARTSRGEAYNNSYCRIWHIVGGKVKSMTEYLDTELLARAFRAN